MRICHPSTTRLRNLDKELRALVQSYLICLMFGGLILLAGLLSGAAIVYLSQYSGVLAPYNYISGAVVGTVVAGSILRWIWKI